MFAEVQTMSVGIDLIQKNDIAHVSAGEKIPADGVIVFGTTEIDESLITGEAMPVNKQVGDTVIGGSINGPFVIYFRVNGAGKKSQLHKIIEIVKESQVNKAPVQRFADYIAARFVVFVLGLSVATFIFWALFIQFYPEHLPDAFLNNVNGPYYVALKLTISVVVVACPCALGLAAPTAVMVGTGVGATHGALIKGGDVLEKSSGVNVILFDKTGTLTCGEMNISKSNQLPGSNGISSELWWELVGSTEANSEHPVGRAIARHAKEKLHMSFEEDQFRAHIADFQILTGMGVMAQVTVEGIKYQVAVGNKRLILRDFPQAEEKLQKVLRTDLKSSTFSICHVVIDGEYCGFLELGDSLKPCARPIIRYLQEVEEYQVGIVTGDNREAAYRVGAELGVPSGNVFAEISPLDKAKVVREIQERFGGEKNVCIAFVGDGINDAPALVQADIGMAIGTGTDIAVDSAEVVVMGSNGLHNDLYGIVNALEISAATFLKIKWNFACATVYNMIMLPFAMGCFLKFHLMLSPVAAAAAMACSSISVVVNPVDA